MRTGTMSAALMPRRGGLVLAGTLACVLGCTGRRGQAPQGPVAAAQRSTAPGAPASSGGGSSEGATLPAPPSADDPSSSGSVQSADDPAEQERKRAVSPDGERIVFVKPEGPKGKPSLWVSRKDGTEARKLVDVETTKVENPHAGSSLGETSVIFELSFSPDGRKVYFLAEGWTTSLALYAVELDGGKLRFVHDALGYTVIHACTDKKQIGRLITLRHSYFDPVPSQVVNWHFLLDEKGQQLGVVGPETENVERFMAKRCGVGAAPPDPPKVVVPPRLRAPRLDCGDQVLRHDQLQFLDGTALDLFYIIDKESLKEADPPYLNDVSLSTAEAFVDASCPVAAPRKK